MAPLPPNAGIANGRMVDEVRSEVKKFSMATQNVVYTQDDVDLATKEGIKLLISDGHIYNVTNWYKHHPGGELTMSHLFGQDATDYIRAFHPKSVLTDMMPKFRVGKFKSNPKSAADRKLAKKFSELTTIVENEFMETDMNYYRSMLARYALQFCLSLLSCYYLPNGWDAVVGGFFMATFWQQVAFYCHDSGHNGISHDRNTDYSVAVFLASCFGGLSMGWWKDSHNVHHIITNHPAHDPDVQHMPVFAVSEKYFNEDKPVFSTFHKRSMIFDGLAKIIVPYQNYCYLLINAFGRFLLYGLSWTFAIKGEKPEAAKWRRFEAFGMLVFAVWYISLCGSAFENTWTAMGFVLMSHLSASILHLQINVSHYAMDTSFVECDEHFAAKALRTTMDVSCPPWFDWFHGGLQFQVIHHLFPRVPRHNLRKLKPLVVQFCKDTDLEYLEYGFIEGQMIVIAQLRVLANHCWLLMSSAGEKIHI